MGKKAPDPPDLGPMAEGSVESARIAQETARDQLSWAKEQDTLNRQLLDRVLTSQEAVQADTLENARADRARYEQIYQPLEDNLVQEFQNYDSPDRRSLERGRAIADVNASFDAQRRNALQRLESYGVDPSQTRNAALDIGMRTQQAAAQAGAASASDRATEQTGRALRAEALNIGKGYPSNVAGSYGQSIQAGNSMVGNANQTTATSGNAMQGANSYLNTAIGGYGSGANIMSQGYQNQMAQYNANQQATTGMLGAIGGVAGMFMKDGGALKRGHALPFESEPGIIDYGEGDGSGTDDQVPINASTGEYIIPADVVRAKGEEFFDKLLERYHKPAEEPQEDEHTQNVRTGKAINPRPNFGTGGLIRQQMQARQQPTQAPVFNAAQVQDQMRMIQGYPVQPAAPAAPAQAAPRRMSGSIYGSASDADRQKLVSGIPLTAPAPGPGGGTFNGRPVSSYGPPRGNGLGSGYGVRSMMGRVMGRAADQLRARTAIPTTPQPYAMG